MSMTRTQAKPERRALTPAEQSVIDSAWGALLELVAEERANTASGWVGIKINIQEGVLKGTARRQTEVSRSMN